MVSDLSARQVVGKQQASAKKGGKLGLGVSSLTTEWKEGESGNYRPEEGSACFSQAEFKEKDWAYPASSIMDAAFGRGHTIWKFAEATQPDEAGWQTCVSPPMKDGPIHR
jgi:hypothetical protein